MEILGNVQYFPSFLCRLFSPLNELKILKSSWYFTVIQARTLSYANTSHRNELPIKICLLIWQTLSTIYHPTYSICAKQVEIHESEIKARLVGNSRAAWRHKCAVIGHRACALRMRCCHTTPLAVACVTITHIRYHRLIARPQLAGSQCRCVSPSQRLLCIEKGFLTEKILSG